MTIPLSHCTNVKAVMTAAVGRSVGLLAGLALAALVAGCQSTPRHFDGAVGYTFSKESGRWSVSYTDKAIHDWNELESRALAACAGETGEPASTLRLSNLDRSEFVRNVPVAVSYPSGVVSTQTNAGAAHAAANMQEAPHIFTQTETVTRRLGFRKVSAICQAG